MHFKGASPMFNDEIATKVTLGRKVLVPGVGLKPMTLVTPVRCSTK